MGTVALRPVRDDDLAALFAQTRDPVAVRMAAFTVADPDDRVAFDARLARLRTTADIVLQAVTWDDALVGSISSFVVDGHTEITYWIDRAVWGRGIASTALALFLDLVTVRPLHARVASDNAGSLRVLRKAGFEVVAVETSFANGRQAEIEETALRLDRRRDVEDPHSGKTLAIIPP